jgi:hypothetical protein
MHRAAQMLGLLDHDPGVGRDAAAVKSRLQHPTLAQVEFALTRQQTVSEHDPRPFKTRPLLERSLVGDQHMTDQVCAEDHVDVLRADAEVHKIAVQLMQLAHHSRWVVMQAGHDAQGAERTRAGRESVAPVQVRYCRDPLARLQPRRGVPWWLRAYLLVGAVQGLAIGLTGLFRPGHVIGFPLATTPLNTRFVAAFYLAGATGLILSAAARRAIDTRIFLVGFVVVTSLLLAATIWYWSTYTAGGVPYPWTVSYVVEPILGAVILIHLRLAHAVEPGRHPLSPLFIGEAIAFGALGAVLLLSPSTAVRMWPWALTAVLARTYAAIFIAFAVGAALAARERRAAAVRPFAVSCLVLIATTAGVSLVHHAKFDGGPSTWVWAVALALGLAGFAAASAATLRPASEST